ncbi:contractile injection system protein, VgrG/Pvc8 family [Saccharospirillum salsuginis]|uniref:Type VI secretion system tip protein VgrG n=1 Tax=Saccharospirillum salsuginis TaxID=418750 RepID=A0A918KRC6_9GAMM|nr:contractile injection system protein, VgrG/Pvc8 family [Saccharospirillum salsuginis]GGX73025.1 hypothetical protein GCM10007392_45550 [Saccharospirillum salsuginis]
METKASLLRTEIDVRFASLNGLSIKARSLEGSEMINRPTRLDVNLHTQYANDLPVTPGELLDQPIQVIIDGPGLVQPRRIHLSLMAADESWTGDAYHLNLTLASKLERGSRLGQTRLFMGMTREQVVWQLMSEMGYDRFEVDLALDPVSAFEGPFLQVQDETTLECFQRLLAEVGANYWFEDRDPEQNHELLVIRNDTQISPYLPFIEWGQTVSGLSPDQQLNRITAAYQRWSDQPHIAGRSVQGTTPGAISREDADYRSFTPPRPRPEAEQRALFEQQYFDQQRYFITLHGHQPLLSAGHSVAFDAGQLPNECPSGEYRMIQVVHNAEPAAGEGNAPGVQYRNTAVVIPRATPPRPKVKAQPPLPHLFPARIESRYDHAELAADGRYYFRADFDRSAQGKGQASPPTSRLTPYASPGTDDTEEIGWHFPLLDQSRALVTFLDDDPARPMIVGFVPGQSQFGPVTNRNATQSRIVTPGLNELTFDDTRKAACIALHTFDRQVRLELNAQDAEPYVHLMAIYGGVNLYADLNLMIEAEAQLEERIGADRTQTVKNTSRTTTEEGSINHQAETDQTHTAQVNLSQSAGEDFSLWVQKQNLSILTNTGMDTSVTNGNLQLQVQAGAAIHQVNGNITVQGNGNGDILLKQGDGGVKIDPSGNIKLFGKKVTLNGQSGVVFDGEVQYETGAGNEPESVSLLHADLIKEAALIKLDPFVAKDSEPRVYERPTEEPEQSPEPTVDIVTAVDGQAFHLSDRNPPGDPISPQFFDVTVRNGETPEMIAWRYLGIRNARRIYYYNEGYSKQNPPKPGDTLKLPKGWALDVEIRSANVHAVTVELVGDRPSQQRIDVGDQRVQFPLKAGRYQLIASAEQAEARAEFEVTEEQLNLEWLDFQALYNDTWQTPLPLFGVNVPTDGALVTEPHDVPVDEPARQASHLFEQLPNGELSVEIPVEDGLEAEIDSLRNSLVLTLDGAYRATVADMVGFQRRWDTYGYAAIALDGHHGSMEGGTSWVKDQATLFEVETWKNLGDKIAEGTSKALDMTADYAVERYRDIVQSANDASDWVDEHSDDLHNWNWWQTQSRKTLQEAREAGSALVDDVQAGLDDAVEFLGESRETLEKMYRYREDILTLPDLIATGDVDAIEHFIDTVLMDIDPELAAAVKDNPNYTLALALIADHDAALTYVMYLSLIFEAVPPNFYAYIAGKGGAYLALELLVLALTSLLTLGVGTAARLTMIAARLSARSAQLARAGQKIERAQQAMNAFIKTIEDIVDSLTTMERLGGKLVKARNSGLVLKARPNTRLEHRKDTTRREQRCRLCQKTDHTTPRSLRGVVVAK